MSLVCLIILVALIYIRPAEFVPFLKGKPVVALFTLMAGAAVAADLFANKVRPRLTASFGALLGLWMALTLSHLYPLWLTGLITGFKQFFTNVFFFFLMAHVARSPKAIRSLIICVAACSLVLAIQGIVQSFTGVGLGGATPTYGRIRYLGLFHDPNDLALTLVMCLPFLLMTLVGRRPFWHRLVAILAIVPLLWAVLLTKSRGGFLATAVVLLIYLVRQVGKTWGTILAVVAVAGIVGLGPKRMGNIDSKEASAHHRIELWHEGLQAVKRRPVLGIGYGRFPEEFGQTAHNSYVLVFTETGLVGAFFWVALLYLAFRELYLIRRRCRGDPNRKSTLAWTNAFEASLVGFLVAGFFLSRSYNALLYIFLGLILGFTQTMALRDTDLQEKFKVHLLEVPVVGFLTIAGLIVVYVAVRALGVIGWG